MQVEADSHLSTVNGARIIVEQNKNHPQDLREHVDEPQEISFCAKDVDKHLTHDDLSLLCDLFYLPFEHGGQGIQLLQEFNWLKSNAYVLVEKSKESSKTDVRRSFIIAFFSGFQKFVVKSKFEAQLHLNISLSYLN